ncbi:MAG TPA: hypothetical protein VH415_09700 [Nitrososphaeraceae archaeon]
MSGLTQYVLYRPGGRRIDYALSNRLVFRNSDMEKMVKIEFFSILGIIGLAVTVAIYSHFISVLK